MTSGSHEGTSGIGGRQLTIAALLVCLAYGVIQTFANIASIVADRERDGLPTDVREVWALEFTSLVAWLPVAWLVWRAVAAIRPPRFGWVETFGLHVLVAGLASFGHVAGMFALRSAVWFLAGERYGFPNDVLGVLLYEGRKDVATYIEFALIFVLIQWLARKADERRAVVAPQTGADNLVEVADGRARHRVPVREIDYVEAAGNYVEIAWQGRMLLHRATLASLEALLAAHGFVRIHRSRLVRRDAVRRIDVLPSGDFEVVLAGSAELRGSRRYRDNLGTAPSSTISPHQEGNR